MASTTIKPYDQFPNDILIRLVEYFNKILSSVPSKVRSFSCTTVKYMYDIESYIEMFKTFRREFNDCRETLHLPYVHNISYHNTKHILYMLISFSCCARHNAIKFTHIINNNSILLEWYEKDYCVHMNDEMISSNQENNNLKKRRRGNIHPIEHNNTTYMFQENVRVKKEDHASTTSTSTVTYFNIDDDDIDKFVERLTSQQQLKLLDKLIHIARSNLLK